MTSVASSFCVFISASTFANFVLKGSEKRGQLVKQDYFIFLYFFCQCHFVKKDINRTFHRNNLHCSYS